MRYDPVYVDDALGGTVRGPKYTLEYVRNMVAEIRHQGAGNIRVHPNGFIQLDLMPTDATWHASHKEGHSGANLRLHIWNPPAHPLPRQDTVNEVHDHVFDMLSHVIVGELTQRLYCFVIGLEPKEWTHELYRAVYTKSRDSRLEPTGFSGKLDVWEEFSILAGEEYEQPAFTLHDSDPEDNCVVTVMEKTEIHNGMAHVVCPIGVEPDNSFDRATAASHEYLWGAVTAALA